MHLFLCSKNTNFKKNVRRPDGLQFLPGNSALVLSVPGKVLNRIIFTRLKEAWAQTSSRF